MAADALRDTGGQDEGLVLVFVLHEYGVHDGLPSFTEEFI